MGLGAIEAAALAKGAVLGFSIAAPVGPIGVLCIRRTLAEGRLVGLCTGLGAAAADGVYGAVAALGLTAVTRALVGASGIVRLAGGALLLVMAWRTWRSRPAERAASAGGTGLLGAFGSTFALTITNPMTIVSFIAVFAGLGIGSTQGRPAAALLLVLGVIAGSAAWWFLLSGGVSLLRSRFDERALTWVNRVAAAIIAAFGVVAVGSVIVGEGR
jgi:threonine/homoserine/homoserine lactone efflux protein